MKTTKQKRLFMLVPVWLLLFGLLLWAGTASAGSNPLHVAVKKGNGISVYTASSGSTKAGILYNGYDNELSLDQTNGRNECYLTGNYSVWIDLKKSSQIPEPEWHDGMDNDQWDADYAEWKKNLPCDIFLAEIIEDDSPVYSTPQNKHVLVRHAKGTLVRVCGEFGNDYLVEAYSAGFVAKNAVRKVSDLTTEQRDFPFIYDKLPVQTVYASEKEPVYFTTSANGYNEQSTYYGYTENTEVTVLRDLGDWVQLEYGMFVEKRFLDPEGAHSYPTAWVKCEGVLDRLNVRYSADKDAVSHAKLCSGIPVHVISQSDQWAVIFFTGPNGGYRLTGCVMKEYLSFDGKNIEQSGITQVRLKQDLGGDERGVRFYEDGEYAGLPAGTLLNVFGVVPPMSSHSDTTEIYLCETEDGRYIEIWKSGVLEPVNTETGIFAKVSSAVRMRTEPDPEAKVLYQVKAKTKVEVLLRGEIWTIVKYKGEIGYMMSRYLSFP